jgi:hypothetical protein
VATTIIAVVASLTLLPVTNAGAQGGDVGDWLARINGLRASRGVAPLAVDGELMGLAQGWAAHMASQGTLVHTPNMAAGISSNWTKLGENVGLGSSSDLIWNGFLNSPRHYANLTDPAFTHVGVGVVWVGGTQFVVHRFMGVAGGGGGGGGSYEPPAPAPTPAPRRTAPAAPRTPAPTVPAVEDTAPPPPPAPKPEPARVAAVLDALRAAG